MSKKEMDQPTSSEMIKDYLSNVYKKYEDSAKNRIRVDHINVDDLEKLKKELAYYKLYHDDYDAWLALKYPDEEEEEDEYDLPQAIDDMYLGMKD